MPGTRSRPASTSTSGSLMQDVPGSYPIRAPVEDGEDDEEQTTYVTLSQAVHARRAEYVRPKHVRIKVGTWNVAAIKGTEKDLGGWFVEGKGVAEQLAGLSVNGKGEVDRKETSNESGLEQREDVAAQEERYERKQPTLPKNDPGSLPGDDNIGLYVLGLQEVVDITSATEALRPFTDPAAAKKWREAMELAIPAGYQLVAEQQLIGLLLLVYASPDLVPEVKSVSTTSVGTGLMGYMGNKGAVTARIILGDTTRLVFVNSHLAAGADKAALERRNWDASQIVQRTRFEPIQDAMYLQQTTGEQIGDEDFAFWVGDLNYRLGVPGYDVRKLLMLHTRNEYDLSQESARKVDHEIQEAAESAQKAEDERLSLSSDGSSKATTVASSSGETRTSYESTAASTVLDEVDASADPTSLQSTLSSLLPHDELQKQMKERKAFHDGWREGSITFLPTYKYDIGSVGVFDSSEKKRAPSWCDRILYRTRRDKLAYETKIKEEENARKKDKEMEASGTDHGGDDEEILYDYDPENDGTNTNDDYDEYDEYNDVNDGVVITKEGFEDEISLEYYTAHQRVLSSDHKPLNAIFMLKYDAVVPDLKAKVHAEVAKDLDKAENEGRPNVTIVVDQIGDQETEQQGSGGSGFEGVWFGDVRWARTKQKSLTIANTSRVPAKFNFIERPVDADQAPGIAPSWLKLRLNGSALESSTTATVPVTVEPGETASLELQIFINDMNLVQTLNNRDKTLEDILVLRVESGRDHFIPVRGKWQDTSLGRSIDKLIRIPEGGIRKLQNQRPDSSKSRGESRPNSPPTDQDPVRFSAPRELFRLTEAIEELATRVVAEWDMIAADQTEYKAPWVQRPGWPFDEEAWSERETESWLESMSEACNALDEDTSLEGSLPPELPRIQRLYILSSLLLLLLTSMPDGIITPTLWTEIETYFTETEKSKRKPTNEEQCTAIQEILAHSPSHSISFILITSMLDRILQEISGTSKAKDEPPTSPTLKKAGGTLRRVTGFGKVPEASQRELATTAWAKIFGDVLVRVPVSGGKKANAAQERRKREVLEVFLKRDEPG